MKKSFLGINDIDRQTQIEVESKMNMFAEKPLTIIPLRFKNKVILHVTFTLQS